jgi:hypothetical protein
MLVPLAAPFLFHLLYQPINRNWVVHQFGCGCPLSATGRPRPFNANHVSMIVWAAVCISCIALWTWLVVRRIGVSDRWQMALFVSGTSVIGGVCMKFLSRAWWL